MDEQIKNLETMSKWLKEISKNNDNEIRLTNRLKMILLNLKIISQNSKELAPLEDALEQIITEMHDSTYILVTDGRKELKKTFKEISDFINNKD